MTLKQRIRYIVDGLAKRQWLRLSEIQERLLPASRNAVASNVGTMFRAEQLIRRRSGHSFEYRAGRKPVVPMIFGTVPRVRTGFQYLARLEKENPAEWARLTNGGKL